MVRVRFALDALILKKYTLSFSVSSGLWRTLYFKLFDLLVYLLHKKTILTIWSPCFTHKIIWLLFWDDDSPSKREKNILQLEYVRTFVNPLSHRCRAWRFPLLHCRTTTRRGTRQRRRPKHSNYSICSLEEDPRPRTRRYGWRRGYGRLTRVTVE